MMVQYKIYATLLDAFQRYLHSDSEEAVQELLDKINRVPYENEAAEKGTAFNNLVDQCIKENLLLSSDSGVISHPHTSRTGEQYVFEFKTSIINEMVCKFKGAVSQVYCEGVLPTRYGDVLLYGFIDELLGGVVYDIKTTGRYEFPKFLHAWQHVVYPYCLVANGVDVDTFEYTVTDFSNVYREEYFYRADRDVPRLVAIVERFIEFLQARVLDITDKKVFAMEEEMV